MHAFKLGDKVRCKTHGTPGLIYEVQPPQEYRPGKWTVLAYRVEWFFGERPFMTVGVIGGSTHEGIRPF